MEMLYSLPPYNFCGTYGKDFESCKVAVLPVPYDSTASYGSGTRDGPHAIISASRNMELYDEELGITPADIGIFTLDELEPDMGSPEGTTNRVEDAVSRILEAGKFPLMFGGEHSVSVGAVRAASKKYEDLSVLHLDAHGDLRNEFMGTRYSHACAARRFSESCSVVEMGIRSISEEEAVFLKSTDRVKTFFMHDLRANGIETTLNRVMTMLPGSVYVSLDIDIMDPGDVPGTGTPEPGGLHWHEILPILKHVCARKRVVGMDIVEVSPIPGSRASEFLAARLAYKFLGYRFKDAFKHVD